MNQFDQLLAFVKDRFPPYAVIIAPETEINVDGLIFRPKAQGGFRFLNQNGEQEVTLEEALQVLEEELQLYG